MAKENGDQMESWSIDHPLIEFVDIHVPCTELDAAHSPPRRVRKTNGKAAHSKPRKKKPTRRRKA